MLLWVVMPFSKMCQFRHFPWGLSAHPRHEKSCCRAHHPSPLQLMLPDGITVEVIVVNQVNAGHLFVQQHTHPTFHALRSLDQQMYLCYSQPGIPTLPTPVESKCCPGGQRGGWALARLGEKLWGSPVVLPLVLTERRLFWTLRGSSIPGFLLLAWSVLG